MDNIMSDNGIINIGIDQKIVTVEFESSNKAQNVKEAKDLYNLAATEGTNIVAAQDGNVVYLMKKSNDISNQAKKETKKEAKKLTPQQQKDKEKAAKKAAEKEEKLQKMADVDPAVRQNAYDSAIKSIESRAEDTRKRLENGNIKYSPERIDEIVEKQKKREMNSPAISALKESLDL